LQKTEIVSKGENNRCFEVSFLNDWMYIDETAFF